MGDIKRSQKGAIVTKVGEEAKELVRSRPDAPYLVHRFKVGSNDKALDNAMKQFKTFSPSTPAKVFSVDEEENILCVSCVPKAVYYKYMRSKLSKWKVFLPLKMVYHVWICAPIV